MRLSLFKLKYASSHKVMSSGQFNLFRRPFRSKFIRGCGMCVCVCVCARFRWMHLIKRCIPFELSLHSNHFRLESDSGIYIAMAGGQMLVPTVTILFLLFLSYFSFQLQIKIDRRMAFYSANLKWISLNGNYFLSWLDWIMQSEWKWMRKVVKQFVLSIYMKAIGFCLAAMKYVNEYFTFNKDEVNRDSFLFILSASGWSLQLSKQDG